MLDALRRSVGSWVAKVFIGLLVLSFAVWGIADIFRGYRGAEVARVGETEISIERFRASLQREIQQLSQQIGSYLSLNEARAAGIDARVLGRLMAEAALDDEARRRGLGMSDAVVAQSIRSDPSFQAPGGQFDRSYFDQYLRATGYSEGAFVQEQRQRLLRQAIAEAVGGSTQAPQVLAQAVDRYRNEQRSAQYILITPAQAENIPQPGEEELRAYFEENAADFRAPEYRQAALMKLEPQDIAADIEVSEDDARASFEARAGQFSRAERRTIEQIPFDTLEEAEAAFAEIEAGKSFEQVASERGLSEADRVLGTLSQQQVVDQQIAEAAFALDEGSVSAPVEGLFSTVLLRVTDVEEGQSRAFEEVADQVRRELALDRARNELLDLYDVVEDDRAAGLTLAEIAERRGLPYAPIEAIDRQGLDPDGQQVGELPDHPDILQQIFQTDPGIEADALQFGQDGYLWFDVLEVTPSRERTFEEAQEAVRTAWRQDQIRQRVEARALEIADLIRGGTSLEQAAEELGTSVRTAGPLGRGGAEGDFASAATGRLFATQEGEIAVAQAADPLSRVVFQVTEVDVPTYTPATDDRFVREIETGLTDDLLSQYLVELQERLGVSVNQQALNQAFGEAGDF